jgi:hypothetical protein
MGVPVGIVVELGWRDDLGESSEGCAEWPDQ